MNRRFLPARSRTILALSLLCAGLWVSVAAVPAGATAAGDPKVEDYFTPNEIARSRSYTRPRYVAGFGALALGIATLGVLALTPAGRSVGAWAERVAGGRWPLTALLLSAVIVFGPALVTLPVDLWRGLYHERTFGLSAQSLPGWFADSAKGAVFQSVVIAVAALGFFGAVRALPRAWPFAAGGLLVGLTVVLVVVAPLVYEPLFNRFTPVDAATRDRILRLASEAGVRVDRVLVADASRRTTKLNAYVSGLGATKRVVLYDTLLQRSSEREVDLVVAHELGHVVHNDVWKGTLLASAGAVVVVAIAWLLLGRAGVLRAAGASGPGDPRALPLLALTFTVATILGLPAANGFSRAMEASADRFSVRLTADPSTAIAVETKLARENIADLQPNPFIRWMFFTHPSTMERIKIALETS